MNISAPLDKLKKFDEDINVEQRTLSDETRQYIFSAELPFPRLERVWYVITLDAGQDDVEQAEIDAMLRHLWMYQIGLDSNK